jgi:CHAD domain-containing protein
MIRIEEFEPMPGRRPDVSAMQLVTMLETGWAACRRARKRCRGGAVERRVHALRVAIRRLLATLDLIAPWLPAGPLRETVAKLRKEMKNLSRLRDTQVQIVSVGAALETFPGAREFHGALKRRERRLARKAIRQLRKSGMAGLSRHQRALRDGLATTRGAGSLGQSIRSRINRAGRAVLKAAAAVRPGEVPAIHRTRIALKKFRYMIESARPCAACDGAADTRPLRALQQRMGRIQDAETLLRRAEKHTRRHPDEDMAAYCAALRRRQDALVRRFGAARAARDREILLQSAVAAATQPFRTRHESLPPSPRHRR